MPDQIGTVGPTSLAMIVGYGVLIVSVAILLRFVADRDARQRLAHGGMTQTDALTVAPTGLVALAFGLAFFGLL